MGHKSWESKPILVAGGKNKEETKRKGKVKRKIFDEKEKSKRKGKLRRKEKSEEKRKSVEKGKRQFVRV